MNYVLKPDLRPFKGVKVTKDTVLTFENGRVKQEIKNLKLKSTYIYENEKYKSTNLLELNLEEGEVLLLEEENRGYFLPQDGICTIEEAIIDYKTLNEVLEGENKDDSLRDEKENIKTNRRD